MMENWTKDFLEFCDLMNKEMETFWSEVEHFTEEFPNSLEELVEEVEESVNQEIEIFLQDCEELLILLVSDLDEENEIRENQDQDFAITSWVNPDENNQPACRGCRHYHGYVYGGNLFVCGMHPYGWEDENCPDYAREE